MSEAALPTGPRETVFLFGFTYVIGIVNLMTAGIYDGPLAEPALFMVMLSLGLLAVLYWKLFGAHRPYGDDALRVPLLVLTAAFIVFCAATAGDRRLLIHGQAEPTLIRIVQMGQIALLLSYVPGIWTGKRDPKTWNTVRFTIFLAMFLVAGISVLHLSPNPAVDMFWCHTEGARAILDGKNPYLIENVHIEDQSRPGNPLIAFIYPPTPGFLSAAALLLGGDVRWGMLVAFCITAVAMRGIVRQRTPNAPPLLEDAPAFLICFAPKTYFFLESAWNDIYPLMFVALAVLAHVRGRRYLAAIFVGLTISSKQSMIWFVPLAFLLQFDLRQWVTLFAAAGAPLVPFMLWDFHALKYWLSDHFLVYPPRPMALSPMAWLSRHFGIGQTKTPPGMLMAAACSVYAAWKAPRTPYAFALAATLAVFCFYLFNRFMCLNYYFFVSGLAALTGAVATTRGSGTGSTNLPASSVS
ncbi:DUF2029 domain-containing protein [Pendulispora rubella]|uniref:DUF2029 domain-containing protein n=1 Tax=Pendulispora rubella TaxID=2741070 RepID=A0ABZ2KZS2_9BACT